MRIIEKIPEEAVEYERPNVAEIREFLESKVAGQKGAVDRLSKELVSVLSGLRTHRQGPRGSVLMMGPSGVGKTESALAIAEYLLSKSKVPSDQRDAEKFLLKVNCGEYALEHHVAALIGAPAGYVGSKGAEGTKSGTYVPPALGNEALAAHTIELEDGQKISVVLLDEIEKAHESVRSFLLGALDKGLAKTAANEEIDFRNTLFLFTSNLGNQKLAKMRRQRKSLGFVTGTASSSEAMEQEEAARVRREALTSVFRPEDVGRMVGSAEGAIVFEPLDEATREKILGMQLALVEKEFLQNGIRLEFQMTEAAKTRILELGINADTGARALKDILKRSIYDPLLHPGKRKNFSALGGKTIFIDYTGSGPEFSFYTSGTIAQQKEEKPKEPAPEETKAKEVESFDIKIDYAPEALAKLTQLNVEFDPKTLKVKFLNFDIIDHHFYFGPLVKNSGYKAFSIYVPADNHDTVVFHLLNSSKYKDIRFIVNEQGLPSAVSFDVPNIKATGKLSYGWLTV